MKGDRTKLVVRLRQSTALARAEADLGSVLRDDQTIVRDMAEDYLYFHALRLLVARDPSLADRIEVRYTDAQGKEYPLGLLKEDELRWAPGFDMEGWNMETEIAELRRPKKP